MRSDFAPLMRRCLAYLVAAIVVLAVLWVLLLSPAALFSLRPELNSGGFDRVQPGMTRAEVEELMGGPPGDYGRYIADVGSQSLEGFFCPPGSRSFHPPTGLTWLDDDEKFEFCFGSDGRLIVKHQRSEYGRSTGVWARVRAFLTI
jgi:hypothetical protein